MSRRPRERTAVTAGPARPDPATPPDTAAPDTAAPGGAVRSLLLLYDAECRPCRAARDWLGRQPMLLPVYFLAADSPTARAALPDLDHAATRRDLTVVADTGAVYRGDAAWLACLWALDGYRELAHRLAHPALRPIARRAIGAAAALRRAGPPVGYGGGDEPHTRADRCR
ncbi:hypothetical protein GCM10010123_11700 [Pilimelia anulata]|uniref:DUF393 domain-containing protein n=1 Tax=Pilimelia anulata TaxID=53371 RepID=A0A8J3B377_9ACTN|nr:DCC1-like thiol-disulfide oxidoreductase family protein [Pilimelia anulata]GGJ83654.1 hypothetical protein GCM10010123_11700 [Pilimelia anulata]